MDQPKRLAVAGPASDAREQAEAYDGLFKNQKIELKDGTPMEIPPHPDFGMLDDDRQDAYEELLFETESYDREPEIFIPEQKLDNGIVLPAETRRGALLRPFRKTDADGNVVRVTPPYSVRVVEAALGPEAFAKLKAGGCSAADVWRIWGRQALEVRNRQATDPKSNGSSVALEAVSSPDS